MKRFFNFILGCVLFVSCAIPCAAVSNNPENTEMDLHLEYMEFYNNQEYYKNLAKTQGYTLIISVGEEYAQMETERINAAVQQNDEVLPATDAPISTYGVEVPTSKHNVSWWGKYKIDGLSVQSTLYTEKKVYGVTDYEFSLYNRYDEDSDLTFKVTTHGFNKSGDDYFYVDPGETVIRYYQTSKTSDTAYLEFRAPVNVEGYIQKGTKPEE